MLPIRADQTIKEWNWTPSDFAGSSVIAEKAYFEDRYAQTAKDELAGNKNGAAFTEEAGALGEQQERLYRRGDFLGMARLAARGEEVLRKYNVTPDQAAEWLTIQSTGRGERRAKQAGYATSFLNSFRALDPGVKVATLDFLSTDGFAALENYDKLRATGNHTAANRVLTDFVSEAKGIQGVNESLAVLISSGDKASEKGMRLQRALTDPEQFFNSYDPTDPEQRAAIRLANAVTDKDKLSVIVNEFVDLSSPLIAVTSSRNWRERTALAKKAASLVEAGGYTLDQVFAHIERMYAATGTEGEERKKQARFTLDAVRSVGGIKQVSDDVAEFAHVSLPTLISQYNNLLKSGAYEGAQGAGAVKDNILNYVSRHRDELQQAANYLVDVGHVAGTGAKTILTGPGSELQLLLTNPDALFVDNKNITVGDKEMPLSQYLAQRDPGTSSSIALTNSTALESQLTGATSDPGLTARMATSDTPFKPLFNSLVKGYQSSKMVGGSSTGASKNSALNEADFIGSMLRTATEFVKDRVLITSMGGDEPASRFLDSAIEASETGLSSRLNLIDLKADAKMYAMARRIYGAPGGDNLDPESFYQFKKNLSDMAKSVFTGADGKQVGTRQEVYNSRLAQAVAFSVLQHAGTDAQYTLPSFGSKDFAASVLNVTNTVTTLKDKYGIDILSVPPGTSRSKSLGEFAFQIMSGTYRETPATQMAMQLKKLRDVVSPVEVPETDKNSVKITQTGSSASRFSDFDKSNLRCIGRFMYDRYGTDMNLQQFASELKENGALVDKLATEMANEWKKDRNFVGDPKLLEPVAKKFIISNFAGGDTETRRGMSIGECFRESAKLGMTPDFADTKNVISLKPTPENSIKIREVTSNIMNNLPLSDTQKATGVVKYLCEYQNTCLSGDIKSARKMENAATYALMNQMLIEDGRYGAEETDKFRNLRTSPKFLVTDINEFARLASTGGGLSKKAFNHCVRQMKYLTVMADNEAKAEASGESKGGKIYRVLLSSLTNNFFAYARRKGSNVPVEQVHKYAAEMVNVLYPGRYPKQFLMDEENRDSIIAMVREAADKFFDSAEAEESSWGRYGVISKNKEGRVIRFDLTKALPTIVNSNLTNPRINWGTGTPEVNAARSVYMTLGTPNEQLASYQQKIEQNLRASGFSDADAKAALQRIIPEVNEALSQPDGVIKANDIVDNISKRRVYYFPSVDPKTGVVTGVGVLFEDEEGLKKHIAEQSRNAFGDKAGLVPRNLAELLKIQPMLKRYQEQRATQGDKRDMAAYVERLRRTRPKK